MEWYHVWWPWLTHKRVARFVSGSWVSCIAVLHINIDVCAVLFLQDVGLWSWSGKMMLRSCSFLSREEAVTLHTRVQPTVNPLGDTRWWEILDNWGFENSSAHSCSDVRVRCRDWFDEMHAWHHLYSSVSWQRVIRVETRVVTFPEK